MIILEVKEKSYPAGANTAQIEINDAFTILTPDPYSWSVCQSGPTEYSIIEDMVVRSYILTTDSPDNEMEDTVESDEMTPETLSEFPIVFPKPILDDELALDDFKNNLDQDDLREWFKELQPGKYELKYHYEEHRDYETQLIDDAEIVIDEFIPITE